MSSANSIVPAVSVGVPAYNGAATLRPMLDALLQQTYRDFEIIISDNASTDATAAICAEYAERDARIRYIRQQANIGPEQNFKFVLDEARGRYFMWSACDDLRSPEFLEENVGFLESHPDCVASMSPNCFEDREPVAPNLVTFAIEGGITERFNAFMDNCWQSHGVYYAVIRTDVLRDCEKVGERFYAADWAIDLYLASRGSAQRTARGLMITGAKGVSNQSLAWRRYRTHAIEWVFPFYFFSIYAARLASVLPARERLSFIGRLLTLNLRTARAQLRAERDAFIAQRIRPWLAPAQRR